MRNSIHTEYANIIWQNEDLSRVYGMVYDITNQGRTCRKARNDGTLVICREQTPRDIDGILVYKVVIDSKVGFDTSDCIGIANETYPWQTNALNGFGAMAIQSNGDIVHNGFTLLNIGKHIELNDTLIVSLNTLNGEVTFSLNDQHMVKTQFTSLTKPFRFAVCFRSVGWQISAQKPKPSHNFNDKQGNASVLALKRNLNEALVVKAVGNDVLLHWGNLDPRFDTWVQNNEARTAGCKWRTDEVVMKEEQESRSIEETSMIARYAETFVGMVMESTAGGYPTDATVPAVVALRSALQQGWTPRHFETSFLLVLVRMLHQQKEGQKVHAASEQAASQLLHLACSQAGAKFDQILSETLRVLNTRAVCSSALLEVICSALQRIGRHGIDCGEYDPCLLRSVSLPWRDNPKLNATINQNEIKLNEGDQRVELLQKLTTIILGDNFHPKSSNSATSNKNDGPKEIKLINIAPQGEVSMSSVLQNDHQMYGPGNALNDDDEKFASSDVSDQIPNWNLFFKNGSKTVSKIVIYIPEDQVDQFVKIRVAIHKNPTKESEGMETTWSKLLFQNPKDSKPPSIVEITECDGIEGDRINITKLSKNLILKKVEVFSQEIAQPDTFHQPKNNAAAVFSSDDDVTNTFTTLPSTLPLLLECLLENSKKSFDYEQLVQSRLKFLRCVLSLLTDNLSAGSLHHKINLILSSCENESKEDTDEKASKEVEEEKDDGLKDSKKTVRSSKDGIPILGRLKIVSPHPHAVVRSDISISSAQIGTIPTGTELEYIATEIAKGDGSSIVDTLRYKIIGNFPFLPSTGAWISAKGRMRSDPYQIIQVLETYDIPTDNIFFGNDDDFVVLSEDESQEDGNEGNDTIDQKNDVSTRKHRHRSIGVQSAYGVYWALDSNLPNILQNSNSSAPLNSIQQPQTNLPQPQMNVPTTLENDVKQKIPHPSIRIKMALKLYEIIIRELLMAMDAIIQELSLYPVGSSFRLASSEIQETITICQALLFRFTENSFTRMLLREDILRPLITRIGLRLKAFLGPIIADSSIFLNIARDAEPVEAVFQKINLYQSSWNQLLTFFFEDKAFSSVNLTNNKNNTPNTIENFCPPGILCFILNRLEATIQLCGYTPFAEQIIKISSASNAEGDLRTILYEYIQQPESQRFLSTNTSKRALLIRIFRYASEDSLGKLEKIWREIISQLVIQETERTIAGKELGKDGSKNLVLKLSNLLSTTRSISRTELLNSHKCFMSADFAFESAYSKMPKKMAVQLAKSLAIHLSTLLDSTHSNFILLVGIIKYLKLLIS